MPKAGRAGMNILRHLMVAAVMVAAAVASCSGQSLLASAATTGGNLATPVAITWSGVSAGGGDPDLRPAGKQQPAQPPDAPSAVQAAVLFNATRPGFDAFAHYDMPVTSQSSYGQTAAASDPGKLVRMISGIARRFDQPDPSVASGTRESSGLNGDTSFAVSRRLALIGSYQHNSFPSFDTMAFGVAFNLGARTNQSNNN